MPPPRSCHTRLDNPRQPRLPAPAKSERLQTISAKKRFLCSGRLGRCGGGLSYFPAASTAARPAADSNSSRCQYMANYGRFASGTLLSCRSFFGIGGKFCA